MPFVLGHWYFLLLVLILVLIFWGPGKLPQVGGGVGKAIRDFRNSFRGDKTEEKSASKDGEAPAKPSSQP
jgi:sec-independent protein translocase protein TatA